MTQTDKRGTVLIVDDNRDVLHLFHLYLTHVGFTVFVAEGGHAALKSLKLAQPDVILLDVLMPDLNGFETCQQIKSNKKIKDIPIIFMTALSDTNSKIKGFKLGAVDYITKPAQNEELVARVTTHITLRRLQQNLESQNKQLEEENMMRRRVQDALRESRERYRLLAEHATDMICQLTPDGTYRYVSPACRLLLGYKIEEIVGRNEFDLVHPDDRAKVQKAYNNLDTRPIMIQYRYRALRQDQSYIWLETTNKLVRDKEHQIPQEIIAVSRDITERVEAELALQEAHDHLEIRVQERTAELVRFNTALRRFVPSEFLQFLKKDSIADVSLGDQMQREMTIFCSDLRSFTTMSEKMSPQENFNFLNTYLGRVSPIIRKHGGFIDKYIGDAVMALFPNDVDSALQAAIDIKQEIVFLNQEFADQGLPTISLGTGIHTGSLMLGVIGEAERMESTVISDSVNLAFRLEGLTKMYGAPIVISQSALFGSAQPTSYQFRFLDRVQVKGKKEAVSVFEVFNGDPAEIIDKKLETLPHFEKGLLHYHAEEFDKALTCFKQVLKIFADDKAAKLYLSRCELYNKFGVSPDWEGISTFSGD